MAVQSCSAGSEQSGFPVGTPLQKSASFSSAVANGNAIIVTVGINADAGVAGQAVTYQVTDDAGNTYTAGPTNLAGTSPDNGMACFFCASSAGGPVTVTVTVNFPAWVSGVTNASIYFTAAEEIPSGTVSVDTSAFGHLTGSSNSVTTPTITTSSAGELIVAAAFDDWGSFPSHSAYSVNSPYSMVGNVLAPAFASLAEAFAEKTAASAGSVTGATFTFTGTASSSQWRMTVAFNGFGGPVPSLSCNNPQLAVVGTLYSHNLLATGGTPPYVSYTVAAGSLPGGLSLNSSTGVISGIPTTPNTPAGLGVTFQVTDSASASAQVSCTIFVAPASLTISPAPIDWPGLDYGYVFQFSTPAFSTTPVVWSISAGSLPPGLTLSPTGLISGNPTTLGAYTFTVRVVDAKGVSGTLPCTLTVLTYARWLVSSTIIVNNNTNSFDQFGRVPLRQSAYFQYGTIQFYVAYSDKFTIWEATAVISTDSGQTWSTRKFDSRGNDYGTNVGVSAMTATYADPAGKIFIAYAFGALPLTGNVPGGGYPWVAKQTYFDLSTQAWIQADTGWTPNPYDLTYPAYMNDVPLVGGDQSFSYLASLGTSWFLFTSWQDYNAPGNFNFMYVAAFVGSGTLIKYELDVSSLNNFSSAGECFQSADYMRWPRPVNGILDSSGVFHLFIVKRICQGVGGFLTYELHFAKFDTNTLTWGPISKLFVWWNFARSDTVQLDHPMGKPIEHAGQLFAPIVLIDQDEVVVMRWGTTGTPAVLSVVEPPGWLDSATDPAYFNKPELVWSPRHNLFFCFYLKGAVGGAGNGQIYYRTSPDCITWTGRTELLAIPDPDGMGNIRPILAVNGENVDCHQLCYEAMGSGLVKILYLPAPPAPISSVLTYGHMGYRGVSS